MNILNDIGRIASPIISDVATVAMDRTPIGFAANLLFPNFTKDIASGISSSIEGLFDDLGQGLEGGCDMLGQPQSGPPSMETGCCPMTSPVGGSTGSIGQGVGPILQQMESIIGQLQGSLGSGSGTGGTYGAPQANPMGSGSPTYGSAPTQQQVIGAADDLNAYMTNNPDRFNRPGHGVCASQQDFASLANDPTVDPNVRQAASLFANNPNLFTTAETESAAGADGLLSPYDLQLLANQVTQGSGNTNTLLNSLNPGSNGLAPPTGNVGNTNVQPLLQQLESLIGQLQGSLSSGSGTGGTYGAPQANPMGSGAPTYGSAPTQQQVIGAADDLNAYMTKNPDRFNRPGHGVCASQQDFASLANDPTVDPNVRQAASLFANNPNLFTTAETESAAGADGLLSPYDLQLLANQVTQGSGNTNTLLNSLNPGSNGLAPPTGNVGNTNVQPLLQQMENLIGQLQGSLSSGSGTGGTYGAPGANPMGSGSPTSGSAPSQQQVIGAAADLGAYLKKTHGDWNSVSQQDLASLANNPSIDPNVRQAASLFANNPNLFTTAETEIRPGADGLLSSKDLTALINQLTQEGGNTNTLLNSLNPGSNGLAPPTGNVGNTNVQPLLQQLESLIGQLQGSLGSGSGTGGTYGAPQANPMNSGAPTSGSAPSHEEVIGAAADLSAYLQKTHGDWKTVSQQDLASLANNPSVDPNVRQAASLFANNPNLFTTAETEIRPGADGLLNSMDLKTFINQQEGTNIENVGPQVGI